jgi:hypothetical protein
MDDTYEAPAIETRSNIETPLIGSAVGSGNIDGAPTSAVFR